MLAALPVELLDYIFSNLASRKDLISVSSVCKLFHAVVDPHLFRSVTVVSHHGLQSLNEALKAKTARPKYVLDLKFTIARALPNFWKDQLPVRDNFLDDFDFNILPRLTKLQTLSLDVKNYLDYRAWSAIFKIAASGKLLPSLRTCILNLSKAYYGTGELGNLEEIYLHPTLESLSISRADCIVRPASILLSTGNLPNALRRLEFSSCEIPPSDLKLILRRTKFLKEFALYMSRSDGSVANLHDYAEGLEEVAMTLESLTMDTNAATSGSPLRLSNMKALRKVAVDASVWFGLLCTYPETTSKQLLISVLPPCLETMEIGGWAVTEGMEDIQPDDPLLAMLQPMFDNLDRLAPALKRINQGVFPRPRVSPAFKEVCASKGISTDF
ncbi:hypothetical protein B0J12DRAFT_643037 [Macrophomina phaseolina]|uniref:F-box domain-containing protein n=1 Tax=Macrophomina phaseolina TaxID=35725 RepID=A0ABQ8GSN2_9PEZI|nr:hypothetical protein B0J12DRAFT_643037 [Macrophomina phaseolina]